MGQPAARLGDMHVCPMVTPGVPPVPHVGGPILPPCAPTVLTCNMPQSVVGDMCTCVGPPSTVITGAYTVLIAGRPAARMGDQTAHGGVITVGAPTVLIGGPAAPVPPSPAGLVAQISAMFQGFMDELTGQEHYSDSIVIEGDDAYRAKVRANLDAIARTPSGARLLAEIAGSGRTITIIPYTDTTPNATTSSTTAGQLRPDGTPGPGDDSTIAFDPDLTHYGNEPWFNNVDPGIILGHEMIHANHYAHGTVPPDSDTVQNDHKSDPSSASGYASIEREEAETAGIPPNSNGVTENDLRSEWDPPQTQRQWY